ncbi:cortexin domain-containing 1-like [Phasianus colchicus]|uniref:cortexin domain-containing 1-like n=1 Tax=Phasianus colchicus TaxID=9054 RepID=UPI00129D2DA7|nr:cortexin domain-containing 1-like [Phasianus colchicus]XP_031463955.1 cortexin domain-containing 1-like [Phasianus colchicus]
MKPIDWGEPQTGRTQGQAVRLSVHLSIWREDAAEAARLSAAPMAIDVDQGFAIAFMVLTCLFLLAVMVRCAKLIIDPYSAIPTSTWEEEQIN